MPAAKSAGKKSAGKKIAPANKKAVKPDFAAVFAALRQVLEPFSHELAVQTDKPGNYHIEIPAILHRRKPLYFAGIRTGKNYVSFHLLPLYFNPVLSNGMSPALKKRLGGKACFNFAAVDQDCFAELSRLTAAGLKIFKTEEFRRRIQEMQ